MRWYTIDGVAYPSVTTILDALPIEQGLREWKRWRPDHEEYVRRRQVIGTTVHYRAHCYFYKAFGPLYGVAAPHLEYGEENEKVILTMDDYDLINVKYDYFLEWVREFEPVPLDVERPIRSLEYGFAGSPDGRFRLKDGLIWVIDFKTSGSVKKNYRAQTSAYKQGFLEENKIVDKMGILNLFPDNPAIHPTFDFHRTDGDWNLFQRALKHFRAQVKNIRAHDSWSQRYGSVVDKLEVSA